MDTLRKRWTWAEVEDFERWHEGVIAQYPEEILLELRRARVRWLEAVRPRV